MVVTAKIILFSLPSLNPLALEVVLHQCPHHPANTLQLCPCLFIPNVKAFASVLARNVTLTFLLWKYVDFSICAHELSFLQLFFFFPWGLHLMLGKHLLPGRAPCMNQHLLGQGCWFHSQNWFGTCWEDSSREEIWIINRQGLLRAVFCSEKRMGVVGGEGELKQSELGGHWVQRDRAVHVFSLGRLVLLGCCSILYKGR